MMLRKKILIKCRKPTFRAAWQWHLLHAKGEISVYIPCQLGLILVDICFIVLHESMITIVKIWKYFPNSKRPVCKTRFTPYTGLKEILPPIVTNWHSLYIFWAGLNFFPRHFSHSNFLTFPQSHLFSSWATTKQINFSNFSSFILGCFSHKWSGLS